MTDAERALLDATLTFRGYDTSHWLDEVAPLKRAVIAERITPEMNRMVARVADAWIGYLTAHEEAREALQSLGDEATDDIIKRASNEAQMAWRVKK